MQNNVYFCSLWTFRMSLFLRIFHLMVKGSSTADIHLSSPVIQEPIHYLACLPTLRVSSFWVCFKDHLSFEWRSLRAMQIFINPSTEILPSPDQQSSLLVWCNKDHQDANHYTVLGALRMRPAFPVRFV